MVFSRASELSWAERVRRMVAQRPQAAWSVNELAASFNLSASTLRRRLDGEGSTLSDCVREVRLETALLLLQSTLLPISDIAYRSGYASHSRFSAAFRERFGFCAFAFATFAELWRTTFGAIGLMLSRARCDDTSLFNYLR
ncbi:helix-turn-helix transcriptional regulator [Undibacterium piscinae]|uniref:Helix-turn-helix transcriptional regulator n=1 Tax=Undibacterium piscinae TaxID=2495591 RepID=A0A6M4A9I5_9BURK|nr:helix-turn-helix transcriptional regulator [Undibacterium piscinae]